MPALARCAQFAPARTPDALVNKLNAELVRAANVRL
jgi:hypothetical protein